MNTHTNKLNYNTVAPISQDINMSSIQTNTSNISSTLPTLFTNEGNRSVAVYVGTKRTYDAMASESNSSSTSSIQIPLIKNTSEPSVMEHTVNLSNKLEKANDIDLPFLIRKNDIKLVERLIQEGANVHVIANDGDTLLHTVAFHGHHSVAELLLAKKANVDLTNKDGFTSLHIAAFRNHSSVVELLITNGANIHAITKSGNTPLHIAAISNNHSVVELLLANGASIHAVNNNGNTPLHIAALGGHAETAELLLATGATIYANNSNGKNSLDVSNRNNCISFVKLLTSKID